MAAARAVRVFISRTIEARAYRRWHDELTIRSRNDPGSCSRRCRAATSRRCCSAAGWSATRGCSCSIEPTRGVDVGARQEIYRSVRQLATEGVAVLVATSDYEEVVQLADRAVVMARGRVVAELTGDEVTTERLTEEAGG